jgi:hypothetical protein
MQDWRTIVVALLRVFQMSVKKEMDTVDGPAKEGNSIQEVKWNCFLKSTVRGAVSLLWYCSNGCEAKGEGVVIFCRFVVWFMAMTRKTPQSRELILSRAERSLLFLRMRHLGFCAVGPYYSSRASYACIPVSVCSPCVAYRIFVRTQWQSLRRSQYRYVILLAK